MIACIVLINAFSYLTLFSQTDCVSEAGILLVSRTHLCEGESAVVDAWTEEIGIVGIIRGPEELNIEHISIIENQAEIIFSGRGTNVVITLYDLLGHEILNEVHPTEIERSVVSIDISEIINGNYILRISDGAFSKTAKFFKQKN